MRDEILFLEKNKKTLDKWKKIGYNVDCHCVKACFIEGETLPIQNKGGAYDAENLPT